MAFKKNANTTTEKEKDIKFEVIEEIGDISTTGDYTLKLRYGAWNGKKPKYDIRAWTTDENGVEKCRKGLTLTGEEAEELYKLLKKVATGK